MTEASATLAGITVFPDHSYGLRGAMQTKGSAPAMKLLYCYTLRLKSVLQQGEQFAL